MFDPLTTTEKKKIKNNASIKDSGTSIVPVPDTAPFEIPAHSLGAPAAIWEYRDKDGKLMQKVCRWLLPDGKKEDRPLTYRKFKDGTCRWIWKGLDAPRPLYGLDRLANKPDAPVIICEGEKATDAATIIFPDYVAVTSPNGSNSPQKADWTPLAGRNVIIWPDHDSTGRQYAQNVLRLARQAGVNSVRIVTVPDDFPNKWDLAENLPAGIEQSDLRRYLDQATLMLETKSLRDFELKKDGVYKLKIIEDKKGEDYRSEWVKICSPLEVLAVTSNDESEDWGRLIKVQNRDGVKHIRAIPMELLAAPEGKELRSYLFNLGLELASPDKFTRDALYEYICKAEPYKRALCVARVGWHDNVFVLPDVAIGNAEKYVVLQTATSFDHNYKQRGTLESWQDHVSRYAVGNSRLALAISAAFAAPLLRLVHAESGGIHFRGRSSIGKSTILHAAGSVWGGNKNNSLGYLQQWRATDNGLEGVAVAHCDTLLCLDELSQVDSRVAGQVAYMLANGTGKSRAKKTGEWRKPVSWRSLFLSNGEISLADKIAEDGKSRKISAGQEVRVIDLSADAGAGYGLYEELHGFENAAALSDHLKKAASEHYGHAGRAFLKEIVSDIESLRCFVLQCMENFVAKKCPKDADGQVRRIAGRFGLIAAGGELAIERGILPWPKGESFHAAAVCFESYLDARGGIEPTEVRDVLAQVRLFIEQHGESRFSPWGMMGEEKDRPVVNRAGFKKPDGQNGLEYYITPEVWKTEVCAGLDSGLVARTLADRRMLRTRTNGKLQNMARLPGYGKSVPCYILTHVLFEGGESEDASNA